MLLPCICPTLGPNMPINRAGYKVRLQCHLKRLLPFVYKDTMDNWKHTALWAFLIWGYIESIPIAVVIKACQYWWHWYLSFRFLGKIPTILDCSYLWVWFLSVLPYFSNKVVRPEEGTSAWLIKHQLPYSESSEFHLKIHKGWDFPLY